MIRSNFKSLYILFLALAAVFNLLLATAAFAETENNSQVLLLKNGNVLTGIITRDGPYFWVKMQGSQLRVPADQVDMKCKNLENAYQKRRASRTASSADSHLQLARWCMHHDMYENASKEIAEAQSIEPSNPQLPLLTRQLSQLIKLKNHQVSADKIKQPREAANQLQENDESLLEQAPIWARAIFVRQVQPLLVHSCATAGCHQSGEFQLNRLAIDGAGHSELTLQNLNETLSYIDWHDPMQSVLLKRAVATHGEKGMKPLSAHKIKLLGMWIEQLALANSKQEQDFLASDERLETSNSLPIRHAEVSTSKIEPVQYVQRDPFDADFFNQRYANFDKPEQGSQVKTKTEPTVAIPVAESPAAPPSLAIPSE